MGRDDSGSLEGPPSDPEEWSDEQWIDWLRATDLRDEETRPTTVARLARSTGGSVLGQAMLAMSQAIYGRQDDEVVVVVEASGEPGDDASYEVHLDPDHPERSRVVFRRPPPEDTSERA